MPRCSHAPEPALSVSLSQLCNSPRKHSQTPAHSPATARLDDACTLDTQRHVWRAADGTTFGVTVSRDDCLAPLAYCDGVCVRRKPLGAPCARDGECVSDTCSNSEGGGDGACVEPPETPYRVAPLQYALAGAALVAGMLSMCGILIAVNRHHRAQRRAAVEEYYREQTAYRNAINALIAAVATEGAVHFDHDQYAEHDEDEDDSDRPLLQRSPAAPAVWKFGGGFE